MKRLLTIIGLSLVLGTTSVHVSEAQIRVNINIDIQPAWGPAGYDYAEYYYIPEIDIYYDVINRLFWYHNAGRWLSCVFLPQTYCYYDFYSLYKVVLNGVPNPWRYHSRHYNMYARYHYNYQQVPIYCMHDTRYHIARNNYRGWVEARYMPRNEGRPQSRDFALNRHEARVSPSRAYDARSTNNNERIAGRNDERASSRSDGRTAERNSERTPMRIDERTRDNYPLRGELNRNAATAVRRNESESKDDNAPARQSDAASTTSRNRETSSNASNASNAAASSRTAASRTSAASQTSSSRTSAASQTSSSRTSTASQSKSSATSTRSSSSGSSSSRTSSTSASSSSRNTRSAR